MRGVYEELATVRPEGFRYATLRLDGAAFMHVALHADGARPLPALAAFQAFQDGTSGSGPSRGRPSHSPAQIGSYRLLD